MKIGPLRHRLTLEQPSETAGDAVVSWTKVAEIWGSIDGLSGFERTALQSEADYRVTIRYRDGITPRMRLRDGARVFGIQGSPIDPDGRRRQLDLTVVEVS